MKIDTGLYVQIAQGSREISNLPIWWKNQPRGYCLSTRRAEHEVDHVH